MLFQSKVIVVRRIVPLLLAAALVLSGCGGESGLKGVEVTDGEVPTVDTGGEIQVSETETRTIREGDGEEIKEGDSVKLNYIAVNGRTGKEFDNTFKSGAPMTATIKEGSVLPGFVKGLIGAKVGERRLVAVPPKDGFNAANEQLELKADDTMVFLFDVVSKVKQMAEGEPQDLPKTLPNLILNDKSQPVKFEKTPTTAPAPDEMQVHTAILGDGPKIESGQTLTIHYVGQIYPDGEVFDESWSRGPATFQIGVGGLIKCWDEGLVGKTIGSRIILECPPAVGYGDKGNPQAGIKGTDTLIFAVDLLDAF